MTKKIKLPSLDRRSFLKFAGTSLALAAGARLIPQLAGNQLSPIEVSEAADPYDLFFAGTDGWAYLPPSPAIPPFFPDDIAPNPFNLYTFGFSNVTGLNEQQMNAQKMQCQLSAPLFWTDQDTPFFLRLTNLGLAIRPDLIDEHTVHWHGLPHVIPFFDGEPSTSVSVPIGANFTYVYNARRPGTYMYHCHVEDTEHVQMGMTGLVFVRPTQYGDTQYYPSGKYVYNDGDGSTAYDREFGMFLSEVWAESHWAGSHVQLAEWSDYKADFALLNGRVYPDTLLPNGSIDPFNPTREANGDMLIVPGQEHLQYQPYSSLVTCNAGERVLLRFANLGFEQAAMTLNGIKMHMVGKDATPLVGRDGTDTSYMSNTAFLAPGESLDGIFVAPPYSGNNGPDGYDTYLLYNRHYTRTNALGGGGGQMTEVRVYAAGKLPAQTMPQM